MPQQDQSIQLRNAITADHLTKQLTAFSSFEKMLTAANYVPSFDCTNADCARLAELYDQEQERQGDDRRAFRYGSAEIRATRIFQRFRKTIAFPKQVSCAVLALLCVSSTAFAYQPNTGNCFRVASSEEQAAGAPSIILVDSCGDNEDDFCLQQAGADTPHPDFTQSTKYVPVSSCTKYDSFNDNNQEN